jgi:hypothetical protein
MEGDGRKKGDQGSTRRHHTGDIDDLRVTSEPTRGAPALRRWKAIGVISEIAD